MAVVKSKYQLCTFVFRLRNTSSAAGLTVIGDIPGGALMAFCVPLKQMSTRSRYTCNGTAARDATVLTKINDPSSSATFRMVMLLVGTPVDISPCVKTILLILI